MCIIHIWFLRKYHQGTWLWLSEYNQWSQICCVINELYGSKLNQGTQFRNKNLQIVIIQNGADY